MSLALKTGNGNWVVADTIKSDTSFIFNGLKTGDSIYSFRELVAIDSCAENRSPNSVVHSPVKVTGIPLEDSVKLTLEALPGFCFCQKNIMSMSWSMGQWSMVDSVSHTTDTWLSKTVPCNVPEAYRIDTHSTIQANIPANRIPCMSRLLIR